MKSHVTNTLVRGKSIASHTDSSSFRNNSADIFLGINLTLVVILIILELFVFFKKKMTGKEN
ncbi:MAG: hypothetical protein PHN88_01185 [Ignavibacteria bacterium]|nr:hypothetical protein [Ignavibacteria bacterium]